MPFCNLFMTFVLYRAHARNFSDTSDDRTWSQQMMFHRRFFWKHVKFYRKCHCYESWIWLDRMTAKKHMTEWQLQNITTTTSVLCWLVFFSVVNPGYAMYPEDLLGVLQHISTGQMSFLSPNEQYQKNIQQWTHMQ